MAKVGAPPAGAGVDARLVVEDQDREDKVYGELEAVPAERWPSRVRGLVVGAGAGDSTVVYTMDSEGQWRRRGFSRSALLAVV